MGSLRYQLLDVFTDRAFGGNQLAVFPDAPELETATMQAIARELNLSETVFVYPATDPAALRKLRIFTPGMELPFAGHPTIGTGLLLVELGIAAMAGTETTFALEEGVGLVPVAVRRDDAGLFATLTAARAPERGPTPPERSLIAALLQLDPADLEVPGDEPVAVSSGVPFLIVPIRTRAALGRATVDLDRWRRSFRDWWAPHVLLLCREPEDPAADVRVRMFAPAMGIVEDPATGAAAAALAGHLAWREPAATGSFRWTIEQGIEMGRPSRIYIEADKEDGQVRPTRVGGRAVRIGEGSLFIGS